jgi:uncharacterized SAM-binding protein YcdF (DUF218 family)
MKLNISKKTIQTFAGLAIFGLGIFIVLYSIFSIISWKRFDLFSILVSFFGVFLIIVYFRLNHVILLFKKFPKTVKIVFIVFLACAVISFIAVISQILSGMQNSSKPGADYVIVLGCQVSGEYASLPLLQRGYTAIRYVKNNPQTIAVLTGGQGPGERITEAESLRRLFRENNMPNESFLLEEKSKNTRENLVFSDELYGLKDKNIVIVTSDYHMFRALAVAKKLGYSNVSGLPARSQRIMLPAYLTREYVTVMYYALTGRF